jgi:predicted dienelactone hydrolase
LIRARLWSALAGLLASCFLLAAAAAHAAPGAAACVRSSGDAGARCLADYVESVARCRAAADAGCEASLRNAGGRLDQLLARPEAPIRRRCDDAAADALGYLSLDDVLLRVPEACADFAEDQLELAFADDPAALGADALRCQREVAKQTRRFSKRVVKAFGAKCTVRAYRGRSCDRARRTGNVTRARARAAERILARCGPGFDALGLAAGPSLEARVGDLLERVAVRSRHFAQRVYPPDDLGPSSRFGPYPVGVRTLDLADVSRSHLTLPEPRPVVTEVYYPSTAAAVAGVPPDVARVLGIDLVATPTFRDVERAPGRFPVVLFSHGNAGIRFQSLFLCAALASHGFVVVSPDHHGNTFVDELVGISDPDVAINRPLDQSFLIDELEAFDADPASFLHEGLELGEIGAAGHSFGGYTTFALAGGSFPLGTFTDPRVKAILPLAPASSFFPDDFFATIGIPTLVVGGSLDETTPFASEQQRPFDLLPAGASVVGLAQLDDAGHFSFSDFCEVPRDLLAFLGGFEEACEPRHLPWRRARAITVYLAVSFFDATLKGDADALARLDPAQLLAVDDLLYQAK